MDISTNILSRRVEKVLPDKESLKKLMGEKKLKLYQGFDPTGGRLHLGHSIGIRKLMEFAELGHDVIFLFGTGTVLVGDPSERDSGRKLITQDEIDENIKNWKDQVSPLVDWNKVQIKQNGDWLTKLTLKEIIKIASNISAVQLFKRESFQRRLNKGDTVWYHETMYPLLQGYDSVAMDVDLEIGGTDQEFNMLIGRELQKKMNNREKFILTTPMIMGTDGAQMSKSTGNCIWLDDKPNDMFGKVMSISDDQIDQYLTLATDADTDTVEKVKKDLKNNPIDAKKKLAEIIVTELHNADSAKSAKEHFEKTFQEKSPDYNKSIDMGKNLIETVAKATSVSNSEAKRLISQSAVSINGKVVDNTNINVESGDKLKIGKRTFVNIK